MSTSVAEEEESDSEVSIGELEPRGSRRRDQPHPLEKRCVHMCACLCIITCGPACVIECVQCV